MQIQCQKKDLQRLVQKYDSVARLEKILGESTTLPFQAYPSH